MLSRPVFTVTRGAPAAGGSACASAATADPKHTKAAKAVAGGLRWSGNTFMRKSSGDFGLQRSWLKCGAGAGVDCRKNYAEWRFHAGAVRPFSYCLGV